MIETFLQGVPDDVQNGRLVKPGTSFQPNFLDYLFDRVKDVDKGVWMKVCTAIAHRPLKPRDLTMADFIQPLEKYLDMDAWKKARWKIQPLPEKVTPMEEVYRRTVEDPKASQAAKDFARGRLEKLLSASAMKSGPGERKRGRVQGGEKYRRMKQS